jgi:hypothetical protein
MRGFGPARSPALRLIALEASNVLNHTELNGQPGPPNYQNICDLGTMGLVDNRGNGSVPGIGNNSAYGSLQNSIYDPRQIAFHAIVQF